jgi:hypothetical protein
MILATAMLPGEYTVQLSCNPDKSYYYVTYGLQVEAHKDFESALNVFNSGVRHSAVCAGLMSEGDV